MEPKVDARIFVAGHRNVSSSKRPCMKNLSTFGIPPETTAETDAIGFPAKTVHGPHHAAGYLKACVASLPSRLNHILSI